MWLKALFERVGEILNSPILSDSEKIGYLAAVSFEDAPTGMSLQNRLEKIREYYHDNYIVEGA